MNLIFSIKYEVTILIFMCQNCPKNWPLFFYFIVIWMRLAGLLSNIGHV